MASLSRPALCQFQRRPGSWFTPLALTVGLSLAGCGGAGSDSPGSGGGGNGPSAAVTAGLTKVDMPTGIGSRTPDGRSLQATNDGVYLSLGESGLATIVAKRTVGRGGSPAGWLQYTLPATGSSTYAATTITTEGPNAFGIRWKAGSRYGHANMNNGGTLVNYLDDLNIRQIVADGPDSTSAREWLLNGAAVFRKSTGGGLGTNAAASYDRVIGIADTYLGDVAAASDGVGTLYAASGATLYKISITGTAQTFDFSSLGFGNIHTLIHRHGRLWVGYADRILFLEGNTVSSFATLSNVFTLAATAPKFCISDTTLYGSDGLSYQGINIPSSTSPRNYLQSSDNVAGSDATKLAEIRSAIANGLYCSDSTAGYGPYVYTLGLDIASGTQKLFVIAPR